MGPDRRWIVVLAVAVAAAGAGAWFGRGVSPRPVTVAPVIGPAQPTTTEPGQAAGIVVHVSGWVVRPGLVELGGDARIGDAVGAAGGVRPGADLSAVNLAQPLTDGQQVIVPGPDGAPVGEPATATVEEAGDGLVHLNSATAEDFEKLPGVGPVLAERIVAHREDMGPFETVEDLLEVSGIGESKLASIRDLVVVP